jgi:hypothetical protein
MAMGSAPITGWRRLYQSGTGARQRCRSANRLSDRSAALLAYARPIAALLVTLLVLTTMPSSAPAADVGQLISDAQVPGLSTAVIRNDGIETLTAAACLASRIMYSGNKASIKLGYQHVSRGFRGRSCAGACASRDDLRCCVSCFSGSAPSEARACTQRNGMDLWISGRRGGDDVVFRHHRQCREFRRTDCRKRAAWCVFRTVHRHCARQMARAPEKETATA